MLLLVFQTLAVRRDRWLQRRWPWKPIVSSRDRSACSGGVGDSGFPNLARLVGRAGQPRPPPESLGTPGTARRWKASWPGTTTSVKPCCGKALAKVPDDPQTSLVAGPGPYAGKFACRWSSVAKASPGRSAAGPVPPPPRFARPTVADQAALARWCRKPVEERHVLDRRPGASTGKPGGHQGAEPPPYQGTLLPPPEIAS